MGKKEIQLSVNHIPGLTAAETVVVAISFYIPPIIMPELKSQSPPETRSKLFSTSFTLFTSFYLNIFVTSIIRASLSAADEIFQWTRDNGFPFFDFFFRTPTLSQLCHIHIHIQQYAQKCHMHINSTRHFYKII